MTTKILKIFIFTIIATSVFPNFILAENNMTIAHPDFYPFFAKNQNGETEGIFYEIITEAIDQRMNIHVEWFQMPWKRCQHQVHIGKFDAMVTVPTKQRLSYCETHPVPFFRKELKLFTYKGHSQTKRIQQIKTIAEIKKGGYTVITYGGNGWNQNNISSVGIPFFETSEVHNIWKMLASKRGDVVIEWPVGAKAGIDKSGVADKIIETGGTLASMPFHLLIGKQSNFKFILTRFNSIIEDMLNDGSIEKIISEYF